MIFICHNKKYLGQSAVLIVRAIESDAADYPNKGDAIQDFLVWSLARMADRIPQRELDVSSSLADETIAYNYLCLLDNFKIGTFYDTRPSHISSGDNEKSSSNRS